MEEETTEADETVPTSMVALNAMECVLSELLVGLLASGALTRWEVAKALLRAEALALARDGETPHQPDTSLTAMYVRVIEAGLTPRLALKPELYTLRHTRAKWLRRPGTKPDPIETSPPTEEPEPPA